MSLARGEQIGRERRFALCVWEKVPELQKCVEQSARQETIDVICAENDRPQLLHASRTSPSDNVNDG